MIQKTPAALRAVPKITTGTQRPSSPRSSFFQAFAVAGVNTLALLANGGCGGKAVPEQQAEDRCDFARKEVVLCYKKAAGQQKPSGGGLSGAAGDEKMDEGTYPECDQQFHQRLKTFRHPTEERPDVTCNLDREISPGEPLCRFPKSGNASLKEDFDPKRKAEFQKVQAACAPGVIPRTGTLED